MAADMSSSSRADSIDTSGHDYSYSSTGGGDSPGRGVSSSFTRNMGSKGGEREYLRTLFAAGYTTTSRRGGHRNNVERGADSTPQGAAADTRYMSYAELQHLTGQQHDEVLYLRNENNNLKSREIEISALSVKLQQQFASTQAQIDHLKSTVRLQLLNPISEAEYLKIEERPESERDLLDTLKLGIYQQIGSLKAAKDTAVRKASELSLELEQTNSQLRAAKQDLHDSQFARENDANEIKKLKMQLESKTNMEREHMSRIKDLEHRVNSVTNEQERSIDARVQLQHKINEVARLETLLRQEEASVARHKASVDCAEQKLDILKSEYYELKLSYGQKVLQLENALKNAEEKLSLVADVELEAEVFIANMASREEVTEGSRTAGGTSGGDSSSPLAVIPPSRRMAHALTITKKCLALENKVSTLEHDLRHKEDAIGKLTKSLEMAKSALSAQGASSQYTLIEKTVDKLLKEKEALEARNKVLLDENNVLTAQVKEQSADLKVLTRHREELVLIREQLAQYAATLGGGGGASGRAAAAAGAATDQSRSPLSHVDMNAKPTGSIMKNSSPQMFLNVTGSSRGSGGAASGGNTSPPSGNIIGGGGGSNNLNATSSVRFAELTGGGGGGGGAGAGGSFSMMGMSRGNINIGGGGSGGSAGGASYNSFNQEVSGLTAGHGGEQQNQQQQHLLAMQQRAGRGGGTTASGLTHPLQHLLPIPISVQGPTPTPSAHTSFRILPSSAGMQNLPSMISISGGSGAGGGTPTPAGASTTSMNMGGMRVRSESHPEIPFCQSIVIN